MAGRAERDGLDEATTDRRVEFVPLACRRPACIAGEAFALVASARAGGAGAPLRAGTAGDGKKCGKNRNDLHGCTEDPQGYGMQLLPNKSKASTAMYNAMRKRKRNVEKTNTELTQVDGNLVNTHHTYS